jgi:hypothetical protein
MLILIDESQVNSLYGMRISFVVMCFIKSVIIWLGIKDWESRRVRSRTVEGAECVRVCVAVMRGCGGVSAGGERYKSCIS